MALPEASALETRPPLCGPTSIEPVQFRKIATPGIALPSRLNSMVSKLCSQLLAEGTSGSTLSESRMPDAACHSLNDAGTC